MGDGNRNNPNWAYMLGLAVGAAGAAYLAYNNVTQRYQPAPEQPDNEGNRRRLRESDVREKHKAAAPYYFFLSSVNDSRIPQNEPFSLKFTDILDPSLGDLKSSLHINYIVDIGWLRSQYDDANQRDKPITILYEQMQNEYPDDDSITLIKMKAPKSTHHTKMCILEYEDGSVRVCVHTANLIEYEWNNCVQGIWLSPLCPALPRYALPNEGESQTHFKDDLIQYLSAYRAPQLQPWIGKLRGTDFSDINVFFVASIPGSHSGADSDKWGHAKLARLLKQHAQIKPKNGNPPSSWPIIAQCSSIGSLGDERTSWFYGEFQKAISEGKGLAGSAQKGEDSGPPPIMLVYPSLKNVEDSCDERSGGRCLSYTKASNDRQPWFQSHLHEWKCDVKRRTQTMPHIKTYTRVSPDYSELAWFHLTSANLSKAAWGSKTETAPISMSQYEAGVLFLPKFLNGSSSFPIKKEIAGGLPVFPIPYDLPLSKYSLLDVPWFIDYHYTRKDIRVVSHNF